MISRFIGKPPYITKSYSRTCRRQKQKNVKSVFHILLFLIDRHHKKASLILLYSYKVLQGQRQARDYALR